MFVASPHASRVVKQLPGWPMGTLGNAGTAAGAPKIHDNFMRSRAGLFSPAAGAFGSQEMVFGAYSFLGWDFEFWKKSFRWKAFNPQLSGGGSWDTTSVLISALKPRQYRCFVLTELQQLPTGTPPPLMATDGNLNVWQTSGWGPLSRWWGVVLDTQKSNLNNVYIYIWYIDIDIHTYTYIYIYPKSSPQQQ